MEARIETLEARVLQLEKNERKRNVDDSRSADVRAHKMAPNLILLHPRDQTLDRLYIERGNTSDHSIHSGTPEQALTFFATAQLCSTMEVDLTHTPWDAVVTLLGSVFKSVEGNFQISGRHQFALKRLASRLNLHAVPEPGISPPRAYFTNSEGRGALWNVSLERKSQMQDTQKFRPYYSGLELIVVFNGKIE